MASEFLKQKWRLWFRIVDVNNTGEFSLEKESADERMFAGLNDLDRERTKEVIEASGKMWRDHYFRGQPSPLKVQDFIDMNEAEFKEDKEKFKQRMQILWDTDIGIMDFYKTGWIAEEVFVNAFKAAGHTNTDMITQFFRAYNPVDGKVANKVIADSLAFFTTNEDETKEDLVKQYLEACI